MKRFPSNLLIPILLVAFLSSCRSVKPVDQLQVKGIDLLDPYVGTWDFVVRNTPSGNAEGVINIKRQGYDYLAVLDSELGALALDDISIRDEKLRGHFRYKGFRVNVKGVFQEDRLDGKLAVTLASFPLVATKRPY